jgi:hypothetical protein
VVRYKILGSELNRPLHTNKELALGDGINHRAMLAINYGTSVEIRKKP